MVDDEKDILTLYHECLEEWGYPAISFNNPIEALNYIDNENNISKCSLIITDYRMPQMNGCELANQIHVLNPSIQMAFITAYENIMDNALNLEVVRKPLPIRKISDMVDKYMHQQVII